MPASSYKCIPSNLVAPSNLVSPTAKNDSVGPGQPANFMPGDGEPEFEAAPRATQLVQVEVFPEKAIIDVSGDPDRIKAEIEKFYPGYNKDPKDFFLNKPQEVVAFEVAIGTDSDAVEAYKRANPKQLAVQLLSTARDVVVFAYKVTIVGQLKVVSLGSSKDPDAGVPGLSVKIYAAVLDAWKHKDMAPGVFASGQRGKVCIVRGMYCAWHKDGED